MRKKIKVTIENKEEKRVDSYTAIYIPKEEIIKYQENDKTRVTLNQKDNILIRENKEIYMEYPFSKGMTTDGKLILKKENKEFLLLIKTKLLEKEEKVFKVTYHLVDTKDHFTYIVEMED